MDSPRKKLLCVGLAVIILMGIFPPWVSVLHGGRVHIEKPAGYAFVFSSPTTAGPRYGVRIDLTRLFLQWVIVAFVVGGGPVITKR